MRTSKLFLK